jgi:hypothetical protein
MVPAWPAAAPSPAAAAGEGALADAPMDGWEEERGGRGRGDKKKRGEKNEYQDSNLGRQGLSPCVRRRGRGEAGRSQRF